MKFWSIKGYRRGKGEHRSNIGIILKIGEEHEHNKNFNRKLHKEKIKLAAGY